MMSKGTSGGRNMWVESAPSNKSTETGGCSGMLKGGGSILNRHKVKSWISHNHVIYAFVLAARGAKDL